MPTKATLKLAEDAMVFAYNALSRLGHGNMGVVKSPVDSARLRQADEQTSRVREILGPNMSSAQIIGETAPHSGAGACHELASVAFKYLKDKDVQPVYLLCLEAPGDHVLAALGALAPGARISKLDTWGPDAFICDPWVAIACRAADYKTEWVSRMRYLGEGGVGILHTVFPDRLMFVNPLSKDWIGAIEKHKLQLLDAYPDTAATGAAKEWMLKDVKARRDVNLEEYRQRFGW